ncbi:hypothetical protein MPNT_50140 [Candidatus Methylacidithermus pantelleriae]|uniref:Uncharacterized protein n=1 Tax=Candidatus Methylacidithermus pantelleriae TaxID=2744239 RepID=A0A8J2FTM6_9BACT|nr:hypothetical protein MPNT_50140 [Candidatus Methylacidithermus pantelleriae]
MAFFALLLRKTCAAGGRKVAPLTWVSSLRHTGFLVKAAVRAMLSPLILERPLRLGKRQGKPTFISSVEKTVAQRFMDNYLTFLEV